jgi:succinate dehydrogenase / fumarate reductase cytochrome b subunit
VNKTRPVHLNVLRMRFPMTALASIGHRLSGFLLFLLIPLMLWALDCSLSSPQGFDQLQYWAGLVWVKCLLWLSLSALAYHLIAGIRHLLMDAGVAEGQNTGTWAAAFVFALSFLIIVLLGCWLWF